MRTLCDLSGIDVPWEDENEAVFMVSRQIGTIITPGLDPQEATSWLEVHVAVPERSKRRRAVILCTEDQCGGEALGSTNTFLDADDVDELIEYLQAAKAKAFAKPSPRRVKR